MQSIWRLLEYANAEKVVLELSKSWGILCDL